jgi:hypothetical protein
MTLDDLHFFSTSEGRDLLSTMLKTPGDDLTRLTRLRKQYPPDRCRAALTLLTLRERAQTKFSRASEMAFDREGLEQSSGETVATYRAKRFRGFNQIADLCCGIGGDAIALSQHASVIAVDQNPNRVAITGWNAKAYNRSLQSVCADVTTWIPDAEAIFLDPSRRTHNRRVFALHEYQPPVHLNPLQKITPHVAIKVAPGLPYETIPSDCECEFISDRGACKEAVLWFGNLKTDAKRRATLLPSGHTLPFKPTLEAPVDPPGAYLYEPDRAVIRAHLIDQLALDLVAWKLDSETAYLSSDHPQNTPFARRYEVQDTFPFSLKRLQNYLSTRNIGRLTIKKRRFPLTPDDLRKRLNLKQKDQEAVLFLTRIHERPTVIVCKPFCHT